MCVSEGRERRERGERRERERREEREERECTYLLRHINESRVRRRGCCCVVAASRFVRRTQPRAIAIKRGRLRTRKMLGEEVPTVKRERERGREERERREGKREGEREERGRETIESQGAEVNEQQPQRLRSSDNCCGRETKAIAVRLVHVYGENREREKRRKTAPEDHKEGATEICS